MGGICRNASIYSFNRMVVSFALLKNEDICDRYVGGLEGPKRLVPL